MKQDELPSELAAIDAKLKKARREIEDKLEARIPFNISWSLTPLFRFTVTP